MASEMTPGQLFGRGAAPELQALIPQRPENEAHAAKRAIPNPIRTLFSRSMWVHGALSVRAPTRKDFARFRAPSHRAYTDAFSATSEPATERIPLRLGGRFGRPRRRLALNRLRRRR